MHSRAFRNFPVYYANFDYERITFRVLRLCKPPDILDISYLDRGKIYNNFLRQFSAITLKYTYRSYECELQIKSRRLFS